MVLERLQPATARFASPGDLAQHLDSRTLQTPALQRIDEELTRLLDTPDGRLIVSMPPQEGKSQRCSRWFPLWALERDHDLRVAIVSYELSVARRWGRSIRDDITMHPELGMYVRTDVAAQHEWQIEGHQGGVYSAGVGGALTGRPVDLMVIDDPVKDREQADSAVYRQKVWDWWTDVGSTRLAPGAPVVLILTRWHEDDLAGRISTAEDGVLWRTLNIPAEAEPANDPLGREPGEFLASARGRSREQWEAIKVRVGSRTWNALYQGRPAPIEGGMFGRDSWQTYSTPMWTDAEDGSRVVLGIEELIQSWDMTFKDTAGADYVVGQVWGRQGAEVYLLDQVRGRWTFTRTCDEVRRLTARWPQATVKLVEDKANGSAVIDALHRTVPGLIPVNPEGGKIARAQAISPLVEARNTYLPAPHMAPWVADFVEEAATFPNGVHDDQVDAMSQGLARMMVSINAKLSYTSWGLD